MTTNRSPSQAFAWPGFLGAVDAVRAAAFIGGCALLFWQYDLAPVDWLFGIGIVASILLWLCGRPAFDMAWPQPLLAAFLGVTALATAVAGGSSRFLVTTIYLVLAALAFTSVLRGNARRQRATEMAIMAGAALTVGTIALGVFARQLGWSVLDIVSQDMPRTRELLNEPNVVGAFLAAVYPLVASWCVRHPNRRLALLLVVTVVFAIGVISSSSRLALVMFAVGFLGVAAALTVLRERRLLAGLLGATTSAVLLCVGVVGVDKLPLAGYDPIQQDGEKSHFLVSGIGLQMFAEAPLGTGAGSFGDRSLKRLRSSVEAPVAAAPASPPVTPTAAPLPGFHSRWVGQSADPRLRPGEASAPLTVTLQNIGAKAWRKDTSDQAALEVTAHGLTLGDPARPVATLPDLVDLSRSALAILWPTATRVAIQDETTVAPGALGRFVFRVRAPQTPGTYALPLRPAVDAVGGLEDEGILLRVIVTGSAVERPAIPVPSGGASTPSVAAAPAPYELPAGARRVADSADLTLALDSGDPIDIVLADGVYDGPRPFSNAAGHRLYAATLGGAVIRAGIVLGADGGQGHGLLQGLAFDVTDTTKTLLNSVVHVWGSGAGTRILDATFNGNRVVGSAIVARQVEGLVVQRVRIRDFAEFGILVDANSPGLIPLTAALLEDVDVAGVGRPPEAAASGRAEACLRFGNTVTVRRVQLRSCAWAGIWTGSMSTGSVLERADIDNALVGLFLDEGTVGAAFRQVRLGPSVLLGISPSGPAMASAVAPGSPRPAATNTSQPSPADRTVIPSAQSLYLRVAVESGAIGFAALMAYLAILLVGAIRRSSRLSWQWPLAFVVVLVAGLGTDTLGWRVLWVYAAIVGATLGPSTAGPSQQASEHREHLSGGSKARIRT